MKGFFLENGEGASYTTFMSLRTGISLFFLCSISYASVSYAVETKPTQDVSKVEVTEPGGKSEMLGYHLEDFGQFAETWKMVTVRYREDSGEMRVTYANPIAAKAMAEKKDKYDYPDGSIFAKIGIKTERDPLFASSIVPSGARRFQFMIRDKKKYADTDGWGYVLFGSLGLTFPGDIQANVQACHACHKVAASRDYVFSEQAGFNSQKNIFKEMKQQREALEKAQQNMADAFQNREKKDIPKLIKKYLKKSNDLRFYEGPVREATFPGTVDEIVPMLVIESIRAEKPALFLSQSEKEFSLVSAAKSVQKCDDPLKPYFINLYQTLQIPAFRGSKEVSYRVVQKSFCHSGR